MWSYSAFAPTSSGRSSSEKTEYDGSSEQENQESEPFVPTRHAHKGQRHWTKCNWRAIAIHVILIAANITLLAVLVLQITKLHGRQHVSTSMIPEAGFELRKFDFHPIYTAAGTLNPHKKNPLFTGPPRPELEAAWAELQRYSDIRVSEQELGPFATDKTLVRLTDGSGAYAMLAVYHGLHCVERMHHLLYADHYYPNLTDAETFLLSQHTEHCLDYLRQYVQCNADMTLIPMHWGESGPKPSAIDNGNHQCASWEGIEDWTLKHHFDPLTPALLLHPKFGDPYVPNPDDRHLNLGIASGVHGGTG
ncbi:hypothetical protein B0T25DRAFT_477286 [Lasiosphaeria hispida]|uniref:Tat pathway signal sequence n=1 Tax=Lasiosphaeria hispida TaxID=260671 RepID=A0AAJ0HNN8_9PEZI|nr:hypothetical protein B0T25DRAFT_477286 [Lasiosphaeria hispida]